VGRLVPREWLGRAVRVVIDRPIGSLHPTHWFPYDLNYGFVPSHVAPDGEELDAYILGEAELIHEIEGVVVAIVLRDDDVEDKLVVSRTLGWSLADVTSAVRFQERFFSSTVVLGVQRSQVSST
jgi:inorganic pyrophosphatase